MDVGFIILVGGKSARLGRDKKAEIVGGRLLLERVVSTLALFQGEIYLVTAGQSSFPDILNHPRVSIISDLYPGRGSTGGICTGLSFSKFFNNLVIACDMPFLNPELIRFMIEIQKDNDLVAYRNNAMFEPLHAIYSKNCLPYLDQIMQQNLRIIELTKYVKVRYLKLDEIERYDPQHLSFFNINNESDLQIAKELANGNKPDFNLDLRGS